MPKISKFIRDRKEMGGCLGLEGGDREQWGEADQGTGLLLGVIKIF